MKANHDKVVQANDLPFSVFKAKYIPQGLLQYTTPDGKTYSITFKDTHTVDKDPKLPGGDLSFDHVLDGEMEACFNLIERTSASDYASSSMDWKPAAKRAEMREKDMRFLLLRRRKSEPERVGTTPVGGTRDGQNQNTHEDTRTASTAAAKDESILGFLSFMVTIEERQNVIYIYEIHLERELRGCGLGKHMFKVAEHIGAAAGMSKAMLTVFSINTAAKTMYEKVGYGVDECSPRPRRLRKGVIKMPEYYIMSKTLTDHMHSSGLQLEEGMTKKRKFVEDDDNASSQRDA